jgi:SAM-dependent methyltransferase
MHIVSREVAAELVRQINPGGIRCVLDVGGASGSWSIAWLEAEPMSRAIIFDLAPVIALARHRLGQHPLADRIQFVEGDFYTDGLPTGADLAWVSAIIHQNSPQQNRSLYLRIARALQPGGWILIRDIVMHPSRIAPRSGALFAVNMLSATESGSTYTFSEIEADLLSAGFTDIQLLRHDSGMHSIIQARLHA